MPLILILIQAVVFAHEIGQTGGIIPDYIFQVWSFHDAVHWMIAIPFIGTCYYFRYFYSRRLSSHPGGCACDEKAGRKYGGEFFLKKFHRYFFWLMMIFILIHLSETIIKSSGMIAYNFRLLVPYVFPFTSEASAMQSETVQLLGDAAEWFYVLALLLFLLSCHFFRHFVRNNGRIYRFQTRLNGHHSTLFWLSIISMAFVLSVGGHL